MPIQEGQRQTQAGEHALPHTVFGGRYEILSKFGEGRSSTVYHAHDVAIGRDVVLKAFHTGVGAVSIARIQREAKLYGKALHPRISQLFDVFADNGQPYLVLSYEPGTTLDKVLAKGLLALSSAYRYACDVLEGLDYLHSAQIIHRDIKPSNILVSRESDRAVIVDLGIGKSAKIVSSDQQITQIGELIGTPAYMAPEVLNEKEASAASDVYSAGVVLFEMMTGQLPFSAPNFVTLIDAVRYEEIPKITSQRLSVPTPLEQLIIAMLSKETATRPTAREALQSLRDMEATDWANIDANNARPPPHPSKSDLSEASLRSTLHGAVEAPMSVLYQTQVVDRRDIEAKGFLAEEVRAQIEHQKLSAELFERRTKVWLQILGRESVATIIGAILLIIIILAEIVAFVLEKQVPQILDNTLLLILGYFFGQTTARIAKK